MMEKNSKSSSKTVKRDDDEGDEKRKLEIILTHNENGIDETCQTFIINDEDHTLGNSLKYFVIRNPDVEFCGYNQPHPSENKIQFRIQTRGIPAVDALRQGLVDLHSACKHISATFQDSVQTFENKRQQLKKMETEDAD
jgi:DNA-directed RNA polymerase I and III subunit RPAC2